MKQEALSNLMTIEAKERCNNINWSCLMSFSIENKISETR